MNDRSQGGTSRVPGEIELMIHRICIADDNLGVEEVLRDIDPLTN